MATECQPWSLSAERKALRSATVGLYPVEGSPFTDGKSGGKAILYMTHGLPQVASNSPPIREILSGSGAGYVVSSQDEWIEALERLKNVSFRDAMGAKARDHAKTHFDLAKWNAWRLQCVIAVLSEGRVKSFAKG